MCLRVFHKRLVRTSTISGEVGKNWALLFPLLKNGWNIQIVHDSRTSYV